MKKYLLFLLLLLSVASYTDLSAQCSICTKTTAQMGEKPARGLNAGILYLAFTPIAIIGVIGYRWWVRNRGL